MWLCVTGCGLGEMVGCKPNLQVKWNGNIVTLTKLPSFQWRHNKRHGISNHRRLDCLLNRSFMRRSKRTSKLRVTGRCGWNLPVMSEFPAQRASNAGNVSIWWRHHHHLLRWNFLTTSRAPGDENFVKMMTFQFQWIPLGQLGFILVPKIAVRIVQQFSPENEPISTHFDTYIFGLDVDIKLPKI